MEPGVNVRKLLSKDLLEYDRLRKERNAAWEDINWEENELESGTGSPDCETHLKIVSSHPAWKELLDAQKKFPLSCEVHIVADDGFVPCHYVFLQKKSKFLDRLIVDNLKVNVPGKQNVMGLTLMGVSVDHLRIAMTLLYNGSCIVSDESEEEEVKGILRLLQIDVEKFKFNRETVDSSSMSKKKKPKVVTSCWFQELNSPTDIPPVSGSVTTGHANAPANAVTGVSVPEPGTSSATGSSSSNSQTVGLPASSSLASQLPTFQKVPAGTLIHRKPAERIQRSLNNGHPSTSSADKGDKDGDSDGDDGGLPPLPKIQKVAPGSLLPLHKKARLIRPNPATRGGRRGRGGKIRGTGRRRPASVTNVNLDEEDSNGPKGKYEQDHEYVPSGGEDAHEPEVEEDVDEEEVMDLISDNEERRPRTRNSAPKPVEETNSRYPKRKRRLRELSPADVGTKDKNAGVTKTIETDPPPQENMDIPKGARTRGKGTTPVKDKKESVRSASVNTKNEDKEVAHRCTFCKDSYKEIEELRLHLENTSCARHFTGMYDIRTKRCVTCETFFKSYDAGEFMDHIKICACSARPSQKGRRVSGAASINSSTSKSPLMSPLVKQPTKKKRPNKIVKPEAKKKFSFNVVGLLKVSVPVDNLNDEQIADAVDQIRHKKFKNRRTCPTGHRFVYDIKNEEEESTVIPIDKSSIPSIVTPATPPIPRNSQSSSLPNNETFPTASSSTFNPKFVSTPLDPQVPISKDCNKIKRTGPSTRPRPGPLSVKRKAVPQISKEGEVERQGVQQDDKGVKKSKSTLEGQKENNQPSTVPSAKSSNSTTVPLATERNQIGTNSQVVTTAYKLRENLKKKLHPPPVISTAIGGSSSAQVIADVSKDAVKAAAPPQNEAVQEKSGTSTQPKPNKQLQSNSKSAESVSKTSSVPTSQPDNDKEKSQNKVNSGNDQNVKSSKEQSGPARVQPLTSDGKATLITVGAMMNTIVEGLVSRAESSPSNSLVESQPVTALTQQSVPPNEGNQLQQPNPPQLPLNSRPESRMGSQAQPTHQVPPVRSGQTATVSLLNPQMMRPLPSMSSIIGAPLPPRPRSSPPSVPQKPTEASHQQNCNTNTSQFQAVATSSNTSANPTSITAQSRGMLQGQPQVRPQIVPSGSGVQQLTTQCTVTTQLQQTRTVPISSIGHANDSLPRMASRPFSNAEGLEVRRLETPGVGPRPNSTPNQGQALMPTGGIGQQQMYMQRGTLTSQQYQQHRGSGPVAANSAIPFSQLSSRPIATPLLQSQLVQGQHNHNLPNVSQQTGMLQRSQSVLPVQQRQPQQAFLQSHNNVFLAQQSQSHLQQQQQQQQFQRVPTPPMSSAATMSQGQMVRYTPQIPAAQQQSLHTNQQASVPSNLQRQHQSIMRQSTQSYGPENVILGRPAAIIHSNIPNVSMIQGVDTPFIPSVYPNNGSMSTFTTVRLPVTAQMNPLAHNRSIQMMAPQTQQRPQMLAIESSPPSSTSRQVTNSGTANSFNYTQQNPGQVAVTTSSGTSHCSMSIPAYNRSSSAQLQQIPTSSEIPEKPETKPNIVFIGPEGKEYRENTIFSCPDCNNKFQSEVHLQDHQNNGFCF